MNFESPKAERDPKRLTVKGAGVVSTGLEVLLCVGAKELVLALDLWEDVVSTSSQEDGEANTWKHRARRKLLLT